MSRFRLALGTALVTGAAALAPAAALGATASTTHTAVAVTADGHVLVGTDVVHDTSGQLAGRATLTVSDRAGHVLARGTSSATATGTTLHHELSLPSRDPAALRRALHAHRGVVVRIAHTGTVTVGGQREPVAVRNTVAVADDELGLTISITDTSYAANGELTPCTGTTVSGSTVTVSCSGLQLSGVVPGMSTTGTYDGQSLNGAILTGIASGDDIALTVTLLPAQPLFAMPPLPPAPPPMAAPPAMPDIELPPIGEILTTPVI
jgi:hypothetical protein